MIDSICNRFLQSCERNADRVALRYKKNSRWHDITWKHYFDAVESLAAGLTSLGITKGDRVAIFSNTRYEWAISDFAILSIGAVTVATYHNSPPEDVIYILKTANCKAIICENQKLAKIIADAKDELGSLDIRILIDSNSEDSSKETDWLSLSEVQAKGELHLKNKTDFLRQSISQLSMSDNACLHFTSGTSGLPKGVVLLHSCIMSEAGDAFPLLGVNVHDRSLTFLPFAHVLGHIEVWGHALIGYTMAFAESIEKLRPNLEEIQPTIMVAVPRVFEKIHAGIVSQVALSRIKSKLFNWALGIGKQVSQFRMHRQPLPMDLMVQQRVAEKAVFEPIAKKMGGQLRFAVCGGAPLNPQISEFFGAIGLLILEGYGLTETTAAITVNTPFDYRFGSVGKAIGDVKLKIADDGEILVQSKKVMAGYFNDPESSAKALADGWFHTGDIGEITGEGFLRITDRKKDLIKTAGGKYIAPQKLEGVLKLSPYISNVHIHGDQRKYAVALVTLNTDQVERYAKEHGMSSRDGKALTENPKIYDLIRRAVADANSQLASYETIKNFAIIPGDFTIENGELTPSLKVKRKVVDQKFKSVIDRLYPDSQ